MRPAMRPAKKLASLPAICKQGIAVLLFASSMHFVINGNELELDFDPRTSLLEDPHTPMGARGVGEIGTTERARPSRTRFLMPPASEFAIFQSRWIR
jgi:hypothetical protein